MSDRPDDEDEVDLGIPITTVAGIIAAAKEIDELQEHEDAEDTQDEEDPDESDPDAMAEALEEQIEALNEDEQAALVALAWIGRGDHDADEWAEAVKLAKERTEASGSAASYLMGLEMLGDLLSEGLAAFGISYEEEVER